MKLLAHYAMFHIMVMVWVVIEDEGMNDHMSINGSRLGKSKKGIKWWRYFQCDAFCVRKKVGFEWCSNTKIQH